MENRKQKSNAPISLRQVAFALGCIGWDGRRDDGAARRRKNVAHRKQVAEHRQAVRPDLYDADATRAPAEEAEREVHEARESM